MINFENLDGFVVDMRTNDDCDAILEDILCGDGVMCGIMQHAPLETKRDFITSYFTTTYKQVFLKQPHVLQVCEEELYTCDDIESCNKAINTLNKTITQLRKLNEEGLQYATERDNKIEELEDFIGDKAVELLKLEDQINNLIDRNSSLKLANDEYANKLSTAHNTICMLTDRLDKIKEIINNER